MPTEGAHYHGGFSWAPNPGFGELTLDEHGIELTKQRRNKKSVGETIVKVGIAAIASVEITSEQVAKSRTGAVLLFGVWGGLAARGVEDRGVFLVHLTSGQTGYFTMYGFSETGLRGKIAPWLNAMGIQLGVPVHAPMGTLLTDNPPPSLADELIKLAQLRDSGVLTQEEFAVAKAKLLA